MIVDPMTVHQQAAADLGPDWREKRPDWCRCSLIQLHIVGCDCEPPKEESNE